MLPLPFGDEFWANEAAAFRNDLSGLIMRVFLAGSVKGLDNLPAEVRLFFNDMIFNDAAIQWLRRYNFETLNGITATTRRQVGSIIEQWIREGGDLPSLEARLAPIFGDARARRIAATEVTRVFASGNIEAWRATGLVTGKRWETSVDEKVCFICRPLHGTIVELDRGWDFTPEMLANNPELAAALRGAQSLTVLQPPIHPACRCELRPVMFQYENPAELERRLWTTKSKSLTRRQT